MPKRDARKVQGERTRRKIVAAAAPIFNRKGYVGSSMSELMAATGLQKGGIYRHFESKEQLAAEAFDYTWDAARKLRMRHIDAAASGLEKIKQTISNFVNARPSVPGGCPLLNAAIDSDDGNPLLRERALKALRFWSDQLESMLQEAVNAGEVRSGVDPQDVAYIVIASLEGALMICRLEGNTKGLKKVQTHLQKYIDRDVAV